MSTAKKIKRAYRQHQAMMLKDPALAKKSQLMLDDLRQLRAQTDWKADPIELLATYFGKTRDDLIRELQAGLASDDGKS